MPDAPPKQFVLQGAPRAELARLCRQICIARERGIMPPVTAEDEFVQALTTVRATYGPASVNEADLEEIVSTEENRVADAAVIAELIAARLTNQPLQPAAHAPVTSGEREEANPSLPTPIPFPSSASDSPLSIADLLDGMLAQERRDVRKPTQH